MFSPSTTASIQNRRNQNRGQEKNSSVNSNRHTSPRLQHAAALSHGGASSQGLPSAGGTTESRRGGNNTSAAPTPARRLPFSVGWETPLTGTYSVSSISQSTKSPSRRSAAAAAQPLAKRAKRTPNATEGKGSSLYDADDGGDKYDDEDDIIPATDGPMVVAADQDIASDLFIAEKAAELVEKHRQEFMKRLWLNATQSSFPNIVFLQTWIEIVVT